MLVSPADVVARAKATIKECSVTNVHECLNSETLLIDIRELPEFQNGHIPGAFFAPRGLLEFEIHGIVERTANNPRAAPEDRDIVLYCGTGGRSALAAKTLDSMGYRNVKSMAGGIVAWATARFPVEVPS
ncbi:MAG: rhodanese-like domain-containing protein [Woeseiaceae bacterium]|jgi:rhodanese-related sulfurtransferase